MTNEHKKASLSIGNGGKNNVQLSANHSRKNVNKNKLKMNYEKIGNGGKNNVQLSATLQP